MSGACAGEAVAHGNGGTGRLLSDFLLATRLATANQGGGFVNYSSSLRRKDNYGSTHGSYVLPIYNAEGVVTHFAGTSFSTAPAPRPSYTAQVSLLTTMGSSTSGACDVNYDAACSISSAASLNVAVAAALSSAGTMTQLRRVLGDIRAGRYTTAVTPSSKAFRPEVCAHSQC